MPIVLEVEIRGLVDGEMTVLKIQALKLEAALTILRTVNPNKAVSVIRRDEDAADTKIA